MSTLPLVSAPRVFASISLQQNQSVVSSVMMR